ncbi:GNAT family N-acetyltransferase [Gramella sp. MAR_2010_147]|uniref:GNAT family N-acetyltransferase n=1 Tax=Gramella sp. MAR_2010_147 TaxID=1250205 RepID=UPI00087945D7|nr:GNAT family N-acetyltransferase [Gramella sp. MAR_2010_147]SDR69967.1 Predicted N-acetyltransferase YhbS [Gramella sp. MAR_2010_147]
MVIREASESDIDGILKVLKASLGEVSSKKTREVWNYKHINNPFGKSLVLIAIVDGKIVGVRAFMRWQWQLGSGTYSCFRAVDTATDPNFQGRGIFKKLTLMALDLGVDEKSNFVFNTPNSQSRPGYIKMGWKIVGKVPVYISPYFNLNMNKPSNKIENGNISDDFLIKHKTNQIDTQKLFTPKDANFLFWRYRECPLQKYLIYENKNLFIAAYVKEHKHFKELRISELIGDLSDKKIHKRVILWARNFDVNIITSGTKIFQFGIKGGFGPVLTLKKLKLDPKKEESLLGINNWNNSIGDLELF